MPELEELARQIEETARKAGADDAECLVRRVRSLRVEVKNGEPEGVRRVDETSAALRVIVEGKEGFACTTAPGDDVIGMLARDALDGAKLLEPAVENRFSTVDTHPGPVTGLMDAKGAAATFREKVEIAAVIEDAVLRADPRIRQAHKPSYQEAMRQTAIASGARVWSYEDSVYAISVQSVARDSEESQSGYDFMASRRSGDLDPVKVGKEAGMEAVGLLGGTPPRTGTYPAVFPPRVALDLLGALISSFSAEEMQKGRSRLADRRGDIVFSRELTIMDDGTMPFMTGSVPFDDERVPVTPRKLVDQGVMTGCLHTLKTAAKWSEKPTGNAFRASMSSAPAPGSSNLFIQPGPVPVTGLLPSGPSVRFSSLLGSHTVDRVSGDFSLGAAGFILQDGQPVKPFRNGTVSGNLFDLMLSLAAVGDDLKFYGSMGSPSLLFESVIVTGN
ncbi:MAG: TldD/PmbA family protein [bacterium]|nr:TldD/PmbA family protein [bacterium]MDT8395862.1 TldD/PmbA family protein [bacterium]